MSIERWRPERPEQHLEHFSSERPIPRGSGAESLNQKLRAATRFLKPANFDEFASIHPSAEISADQASLPQFETYSGEWSQMATLLIVEGVYNHDWLSIDHPDWETHVEIANRFDDVKRGVDLIIVFYNRKTKAELLLLLDTTTSQDAAEKKEKRMIGDIQEGHLRKIKYYKSPKTGRAVGRREGIAATIHYSLKELAAIADRYKAEGDVIWDDKRLEAALRQMIITQIDTQIDTAYKHEDDYGTRQLINNLSRVRELLAAGTQEKGAVA
jgi:hypothetical protein